MSDILIRGLDMPKDKDHLTITINANGTVQPLIDMYCPIIANAVELPEHGSLIDRDAIPYKKIMFDDDDFYYGVTQPYIDRMPVIVPASEEDG